MHICIKKNSFKTCSSTYEECCNSENSFRVHRVSSAELVNIASKGLEDIVEAHSIAHELSKLAGASKKATKASLTGLKHRLYTLCASMDYKCNILYFNILLESADNNTGESPLADIN